MKHVRWLLCCLALLLIAGGCSGESDTALSRSQESAAVGGAGASCGAESGDMFLNDETTAAVWNGSSAGGGASGFSLPRATLRFRGVDVSDYEVYEERDELKRDVEFVKNFSRDHQASGLSKKHRTKKQAATPKKTWKRASTTPHNVRLTVGDDDTLPLEAMDIAVHVDGFRARVVLDCFFRNDRAKQLHGTFKLRLPTGASPHYLAFGRMKATAPEVLPPATSIAAASLAEISAQRTTTWDAPKEARMVARATAARAYQDTVRQRVDPALMEWAGAGVFSTQVFPLEPGALHQVVIAYDVDLVHDQGQLVHRLDLPSGVPSLDVAVSVAGGAAALEPSGRRVGSRHLFKDPTGRHILTRVACPAPFVLKGISAQAGALFATEIQPPLPAADAVTNPRAVFLVDVSASSTPERFNAWLALLTSILEENRPALREFSVAFFNVETFWWQQGFVPNDKAHLTQLRTFADTLLLEGATDLSSALTAAGTQPGAFDVFLLSDGAVTWGETNAHVLAEGLDASHAVFSYVVPGAGTNRAVLQGLARRSGGAVFPVVNESEIPAVARAHRKRPWMLEGVQLAGTSDLLLAGRPTALFPGQHLRIAGRGTPEAGAEVILDVSQGTDRRKLRVALGSARDSELATRTYGQIAVSQLEGLGHAAATEARAYASHFRVVGSSCSLLMLESEEDYKAREVKPEDETRVRTAPASELVAAKQRDAEATLADPRRRLLAQLDRLAAMPHTDVSVPAGLRTVLEALPAEAFRVRTAGAACLARNAGDAPAKIRAALATGELTYDAATTESERRYRKHGASDGLKVLSSLIEQDPADLVLARDVAYSAMAWGRHGEAYHLLRRVADRRPWESPTWLAVARCLDAADHSALAVVFFEMAVHGNKRSAYGALCQVAAVEYTRLLRTLAAGRTGSGSQASPLHTYARHRLRQIEQLAGAKEADLLVIIEWNTDRSDVDLHITDAVGEHCSYRKNRTKMGGVLSEDVTTGYGPEMFMLPRARGGDYRVQAHYYGSDALRTKARSKVFARVYEDWGRPSETVRRVVVTLEGRDELHDVATIKR